MSSASCNQSPSQAIRDPSPASQIPRVASFRSAGHLPEQSASRLRADCEQIASRLRADCEGLPFHLPTDRLHVGIPPARDVRRPRGTRLHLARVLLERNTHLMRGAIRGARRDAAPHSSGAHAFEWRACIRLARMHSRGAHAYRGQRLGEVRGAVRAVVRTAVRRGELLVEIVALA